MNGIDLGNKDWMKDRWVEYVEPAYDKDGIVITQYIRLKVEDAIQLWKLIHPKHEYTNDLDALMDFITVHWAEIKNY